MATQKAAAKSPRTRTETTRQRPETTSREAQIQTLVGMGFGNKAVWLAMEQENPSIIPMDDSRRKEPDDPAYVPNCPAFDADLRGKISRAINSTRALAIKADDRMMGLVEAGGGLGVQIKSLDEIDMLNRRRFHWGVPALDFMYGETRFVHLSDAANSTYKKEMVRYKERDNEGNVRQVEIERDIWIDGDWQTGDPLIPINGWKQGDLIPTDGFVVTRNKDGSLRSDLDLTRQIVEVGCPESFISIWGGEPGVGKTKLAADTGKAVNKTTEETILYINGEDNEESFRMKCGMPPNPFLFKVVTAKLLPVDTICQMARKVKPRLIIVDSVQTLAEWDKGPRGQKTCLMILQALMNDPTAGKPHIILISQLNKQGDLKGIRDLEHLADCVVSVTKEDVTQKGVFNFACRSKNRAAPTPRNVHFKHLTQGVVALENFGEDRGAPAYNLSQHISPTIAAGVTDEFVVEKPNESAGTNN